MVISQSWSSYSRGVLEKYVWVAMYDRIPRMAAKRSESTGMYQCPVRVHLCMQVGCPSLPCGTHRSPRERRTGPTKRVAPGWRKMLLDGQQLVKPRLDLHCRMSHVDTQVNL